MELGGRERVRWQRCGLEKSDGRWERELASRLAGHDGEKTRGAGKVRGGCGGRGHVIIYHQRSRLVSTPFGHNHNQSPAAMATICVWWSRSSLLPYSSKAEDQDARVNCIIDVGLNNILPVVSWALIYPRAGGNISVLSIRYDEDKRSFESPSSHADWRLLVRTRYCSRSAFSAMISARRVTISL